MLPITLGNLLTWGIPFTDHFMTASLGSDLSTGIFLSNQVSIILGFLVTGLESGISIVGSQSLGEGDRGGFAKTVSAVLYLTLALSFVFTLISFLFPDSVLKILSGSGKITDTGAAFLKIIALSFPIQSLSRIIIASARAEGAPSLSLIAPLTALISNTLLNYLMIDGVFKLGAVGVGYATLISRGIELGVSLIFTICSKKIVTRPKDMLITTKSSVTVLKKSLFPILTGQAVWAFSNLFSTSVMSHMGSAAAHAFAVTASLMNLVYTAMNGASVAAGIMISRSVGRACSDTAKQDSAPTVDTEVEVAAVKETPSTVGKKSSGSAAKESSRCIRSEGNTLQDEGRVKLSDAINHRTPIAKGPREIAHIAEGIFLAVGLLSFIIITILREPFIALYKLDAVSAALARSLIPIMAATFVATSYSAPSLFGIIKSGGDVSFVTFVDLLSFFLLTLPLTLVLSRTGASCESVYIALRIEHIVKCPIAYARIRQGHFTRRLTAAPE
ncbi:MAG: MATE family efflux transporter [Clostridia bacterium]|nr:MATE family efflux transporter [Clostridia bacterium]